jgi:hypothetical protein
MVSISVPQNGENTAIVVQNSVTSYGRGKLRWAFSWQKSTRQLCLQNLPTIRTLNADQEKGPRAAAGGRREDKGLIKLPEVRHVPTKLPSLMNGLGSNAT